MAGAPPATCNAAGMRIQLVRGQSQKDIRKAMLTHSPADSAAKSGRAHFTSRTVTIKPGGRQSVGLGVYNTRAAGPEFTLTVKPDMGDLVEAALDRLDIPGKSDYMLLYRFCNKGTQDCTIEVRQQPHAA